MRAEISVRAAQLDDLDAIVELRMSLLREYDTHPFYAHLHPDATERAHDLYRAQLTSPYETVFIARRGRRAIGLLRCVETRTSPVLLPERYCYVSSVFVIPEERRQGVLHALMRAADQWCDERGLTEMRLHNSSASTEAREAWSALGFDVVEEVRRRELVPPAAKSALRDPAASRSPARAR